jgi:uncharacterized protein
MVQKTAFNNKSKDKIVIKTLYGTYKVGQPFVDLIKSPTIQRLKKISQCGTIRYSESVKKDFSRYAHTMGVLVLLKKFKASQNEQLAGLFHDASHTVFSHVADYVFGKNEHVSYQDEIHEWFLKEQRVDKLLKKHNLTLAEVLHKSGKHQMLEQELPNICIDRLEYNLHSGLKRNLLTKEEIKKIITNLKFENNNFFFSNINIAKKFAYNSLFFTEKIWCCPENNLSYKWLAKALKRALDLKIVSPEEIHFSTDSIIWTRLKKSKDQEILNLIQRIYQPQKYFEKASSATFTEKIHGKFRGIDPFIKTNKNLIRLTELDPEFKKEFDRVKQVIHQGRLIRTF